MSDIAPTAASAPKPAPSAERAKLSAAARQFEAIFVRQMLSQARQGGFGDKLFGNQAGETFRQMQDDRFADIAADRGMLGLAAAIERQLGHKLAPQPGVD